jgi:hypothetical protein
MILVLRLEAALLLCILSTTLTDAIITIGAGVKIEYITLFLRRLICRKAFTLTALVVGVTGLFDWMPL